MTLTDEYGLVLPEIDVRERAETQIDIAGWVTLHTRTLFRVAYSVLRSESEAEDVVQDCFVRVLQQRRGLDEIRDVRVWLVRIAWNLALDRRRRVRPAQFDERFAAGLVAPGIAQDEALEDADRLRAVLAEMDRLPKREREVLLLSAVEELDTTEMAAVLGRSDSAVRALLFRARTRLRERLAKAGGGKR